MDSTAKQICACNIKSLESVALGSVKACLLKFFCDKGYYFDVAKKISGIYQDFTLNTLFGAWADTEMRIFEEEPVKLTGEQRGDIETFLYDTDVSFRDAKVNLISYVYESSISNKTKKSSGITYTPDDICEYMTDLLRGKIRPDQKFLDPACGAGNFLSAFYDILMELHCVDNNEQTIKSAHIKILTENIYGCDTSKAACAVSEIVLALKYKECVIAPHIYEGDSLLDLPPDMKDVSFDYIMTNPPYIGHKQIAAAYKKKLKRVYGEVFYDKADISYCFFMLAHRLLKEDGHLLFVTSRYFTQSLFARGLREYLLRCFTFLKFVDFFGVRPFKHAGIDPIITYMRKNKPAASQAFEVLKLPPGTKVFNVQTERALAGASVFVAQDELSAGGFQFLDDKQKHIYRAVNQRCTRTLGDIAEFYQGVISGCDKAFVVRGGADYEPCIRECGVRWIKSRNLAETITWDNKYLLYTNGNRAAAIGNSIKHLSPYRSLLENRRECRQGTRKWHELQWPRAKQQFLSPKLIFAYKAEANRFLYDAGGYFFSADIYALYIKSAFADEIDIDRLRMYLNSAVCDMYFKCIAKKLGGALYEYYPNTVKKIPVPANEDLKKMYDADDIGKFFDF